MGYVAAGIAFLIRQRRAANFPRKDDAEKTVVTDPAPITSFESWGGWKLM